MKYMYLSYIKILILQFQMLYKNNNYKKKQKHVYKILNRAI